MNLSFKYDRQKDVECLLQVGPGGHNSPYPTPEYKLLVTEVGDSPNEDSTNQFIDKYLKEKNFDISEYTLKYQDDFDEISEEFQKRAEKIFKVSIKDDVTAYLTVNRRLPYNLKENYFFVCVGKETQRRSVMHELWHFYTWHKYGQVELKKLGFNKYNDIKESLTVLLNVVYADLLLEGLKDEGYPQHQKLRGYILKCWHENSDIDDVWQKAVNFL